MGYDDYTIRTSHETEQPIGCDLLITQSILSRIASFSTAEEFSTLIEGTGSKPELFPPFVTDISILSNTLLLRLKVMYGLEVYAGKRDFGSEFDISAHLDAWNLINSVLWQRLSTNPSQRTELLQDLSISLNSTLYESKEGLISSLIHVAGDLFTRLDFATEEYKVSIVRDTYLVDEKLALWMAIKLGISDQAIRDMVKALDSDNPLSENLIYKSMNTDILTSAIVDYYLNIETSLDVEELYTLIDLALSMHSDFEMSSLAIVTALRQSERLRVDDLVHSYLVRSTVYATRYMVSKKESRYSDKLRYLINVLYRYGGSRSLLDAYQSYPGDDHVVQRFSTLHDRFEKRIFSNCVWDVIGTIDTKISNLSIPDCQMICEILIGSGRSIGYIENIQFNKFFMRAMQNNISLELTPRLYYLKKRIPNILAQSKTSDYDVLDQLYKIFGFVRPQGLIYIDEKLLETLRFI